MSGRHRFPEMMDGRVKTLHPKIHGGILARRTHPEDLELAKEHGSGSSICDGESVSIRRDRSKPGSISTI